MTLEEIYLFLKEKLTVENLQEISLRIIEAYKNRNTTLLQSYAEQIHLEADGFREKGNRLFLTLIKHFHPDRLGYFQLDIEQSYRASRYDRLIFYRDLLTANRGVERQFAKRFEYSPEEEYQFDAQDIGYDLQTGSGEHDSEFINEVEIEMGFMQALKSAYMGNLDLHIDHGELETFEGDLILCDYGIVDLEGLQYCSHVSSLNLSYNRISSIYELKNLFELRELFLNSNRVCNIEYLENLSSLEIVDLAYNDIENGHALTLLPNLRFLDIRGNPLDRGSIEPLFEKEDFTLII